LAVSALLALPTFAGFAGGAWWVLDLFSHFRMQYALCGLICLAGSLFSPSRMTLLAALPFAVNLACIGALYFGAPRGSADEPPLVITSFNVHTANEQKEEVVAFLSGSGADVIFLYEVDRAWVDAMADLPDEYRMIMSIPSPDNFGIAAIARVPIAAHRKLILSSYGLPSIELTVPWQGREIVLLGTHTLPPINALYAAGRDEQLARIAAWSVKEERPHALLGDLNATPWSAAFCALLEEGRLEDTSGGWDPTWPNRGPHTLLFKIPIDHALLGPGLAAVERSVGDNCGSDHRPLTISLTLDR
jgi:endonuclease/exonuclease/phosphatase (EEP) superfamily protein YafD